ncbi:MAG: hypothetical protein J6P37_04200 [Lachnospiraceae bacterium]|nr:hypothetical protein [Lachnospiraceae bacterium]
MKRLKYIFIICILACAVGCRNNNIVMVPIDDSTVENSDDKVIEIEKDEPKETEKDEPKDTEADEQKINADDEELSQEDSDEQEDVYEPKDYSLVDHLDLSDDTFELFGECAMYLWKDADVSKGDVFSSKSYSDIREFLFYLYHNRAETIHSYEDSDPNSELYLLLKVNRNDFISLLKEVFDEQNPEKVIDLLPNEIVGDGENIYYSLEDDCIYLEVGALGWNQLFYEVSNVEKNHDEYVITYDVFSVFTNYEGPFETVNVTIKEADNSFGYKFVSMKYAPEYLFDQFLKGEIDATVLNPLEPTEWGWDYDKITTVDIDDLNVNHILWSFMEYSAGERFDLDNDGEKELILDGPYGGMYLDAMDGNLYVFAAARGNAGGLQYAYYDDAYWIVYHDTTHGGRSCYWLYKYEGGDNVVDTMTLMGFWNSEEDKEFTFNGESITEDDYNRIHDEIFNTER